MNSDIFQNTFDLLLDYLPTDWNKLIFYAAYANGSYSMKYFTKSEDSGWIDCFSQKDITRSDLIKLFIKINNSLSKERNDLSDKDRWTVLTMIVDSNGNMTSEFDYTDISDCEIEYERDWEKKYLD
jgi:hypothetical protein